MNMKNRIIELLEKYEHVHHSSIRRTRQLFIDDFYPESDFSAPSTPHLLV